MRSFAIVAIVFTLFGATGCAMSPERMGSESDLDLCRSYGVYAQSPLWRGAADGYKEEINRRNLFTDAEWSVISSKKIRSGMSQCAMYASWGKPDRENRSVGSWGVHTQHVYNAGYRYIRPTYVYTKNGRVTSWQD